jgi:hypothetical protein
MDVLIHSFLNLAEDECAASLKLRGRLMTGKAHLAPTGQKAEWFPESVWTLGEERNLLPLPVFEPSNLVTLTITLTQIVTACVMQKQNKKVK